MELKILNCLAEVLQDSIDATENHHKSDPITKGDLLILVNRLVDKLEEPSGESAYAQSILSTLNGQSYRERHLALNSLIFSFTGSTLDKVVGISKSDKTGRTVYELERGLKVYYASGSWRDHAEPVKNEAAFLGTSSEMKEKMGW